MTTLVSLQGVSKSYQAATQACEVLREIDLEVREGESVAVVGPSGSGKSTLLNIIGGLVPPTQGEAFFADQQLGTMTADELAAMRNHEIGYVFQAHHLLPQCSALENVMVPTLVHADKALRREAADRAQRLLADVGLADRVDHRPSQLSGGECQRVAVVRALINRPRLLLADEPTGSLDAHGAKQLGDILCRLNAQEKTTLVTVTHSQQLASLMERGLELREGRLIPLEVRS